MRETFRLLLGITLLLTAPGCGSPTLGYTCTPACPPGARCTEGGCLFDVAAAPPDLAVSVDAPRPCGGSCPAATPFCRNDTCVPCLVDGDCPSAQTCRVLGSTTACLAGCSDDSHCGAGLRCCGGACTDARTDASNCGACSARCTAPHAAVSCVAGACAGLTCQPGWADCNTDPADGCEANLALDAANCAACGHTCAPPHALGACAGACYVAACTYGFADCNGDTIDGCEIPTSSDPRNCGGCGVQCNGVPHGQVACIEGTCTIGVCGDGFGDCNGRYADGCEVNLAIDGKNCGACGKVCAMGLVCLNGGCTCQKCALPNARSACLNLICSVASCLPGFLDCDGQAKNGCEVKASLDPANCGGCGARCGGMTPFCQGGVCSQVGQSCLGILQGNPHAPDGAYVIDPDGNGPVPAQQVYCDMTTDGGGWTIVWSTDGGDNQVGMVSDTAVAGNGLNYEYSNLTRATKMALSAISTASLWKRKMDGAWLEADAPLYDQNLDTPNSHIHVHVNLKASDGTSASGAMGYANLLIDGGGDYGVSVLPDGPTCQGVTIDGFDHHNKNIYYHLNCGCQRMYLYSYSSLVADGDDSYNINTGLGAWTATAVCSSLEGGGLVLYAAMR
jgi:hypothetical protein